MVPDLLESEGAKRFALGFLDMVMTWNGVETEARNILFSTSGGGLGTWAAVLSLKNVSLTNAILAQAEYMGEPGRGHLKHFVKCMERQREHRNLYVHTIHALGCTDNGASAGALLTAIDAKPFLRHSQQSLSDTRIWEFANELEALRLYGVRLNDKLRHVFKKPRPRTAEPPSWPEKPPLPAQLKRTRTHLPGLGPPPPASPQ